MKIAALINPLSLGHFGPDDDKRLSRSLKNSLQMDNVEFEPNIQAEV
jgi:hypothetical protein